MEKRPASRVPYRNQTPPLTPQALPADSSTSSRPYRNVPASPSRPNREREAEGYPESPTRGTYRRGELAGNGNGTGNGKGKGQSGRTISLDDELEQVSSDNERARRKLPRGAAGWWIWQQRKRVYLKRLLSTLVVLGLLAALGRGWNPAKGLVKVSGRVVDARAGPSSGSQSPFKVPEDEEYEEEEDGCQFTSVMEAYRRDLHRLRKRVAEKRNITLTHSSSSHDGAEGSSRHRFSSTGHLLVSDESPLTHPIPLLLKKGEDHWKELVGRQSTTLAEAVREYERRYGRRPPMGFDIWWDFSLRHGLILPDEYDRINLDLAPFFALPRAELRRRLKLVEDMNETFTLVIKKGKVDIQIKDPGGLKWEGTMPRAEDAAALVGTFSWLLPDMKATFSIFDQPQIYISWARRGSLVDLGLRGLHTTHVEESDVGHVQLSRSCAPDSNFRTNSTFQEDPWLIPLHGLTIEPHEQDSHPRPHTQLLPLFSLAKTSINSDILITPLDQFFDPTGDDPPWEKKKSDRLAWRGSPTGISMMTKLLPWRSSHRVRLHHFANNRSLDPVSYLTPDLGQDIREETSPGRVTTKRKGDLGAALKYSSEEVWTRVASHFFFDMKLAGQPLQCDLEDGTCRDLMQEIDWAPHQSANRLNQHKFLLDIDGNGWSGRFRRLMSTNSVVIKTGLFTEWFQPHLIPWYMYIPSKLDFSDLADILAFFRGSPRHPDLGFDETAKAIGSNGVKLIPLPIWSPSDVQKCFVERMFRLEDMQAYMMRLFLEYARLTAPDGVDMDFYHDEGAFAAKNRMKDHGDDNAERERVPVLVKSDVEDRVNQALSAFDAGQGLAAAAEATAVAEDEQAVDEELELELEELLQEHYQDT